MTHRNLFPFFVFSIALALGGSHCRGASVGDTTGSVAIPTTNSVSDQIVPLDSHSTIFDSTSTDSQPPRFPAGGPPPRHHGHHGRRGDKGLGMNNGFPPPPPITVEQQQAMATCLQGYGFNFTSPDEFRTAMQNTSALQALQTCRSQIMGNPTATVGQ